MRESRVNYGRHRKLPLKTTVVKLASGEGRGEANVGCTVSAADRQAYLGVTLPGSGVTVALHA